jgi:hypothetical protein
MNFNELFQKMRELDAPVAEELKGGQKKLDADKDGDIEADDLKALRDKKDSDDKEIDEDLVDECGTGMMPSSTMSAPKQSDSVTMNVSMNGSGQGGIRDLMDILRNIEDSGAPDNDENDLAVAIGGMADGPEKLIDMEEAEAGGFDRATTAPNTKMAPMSAAFPKGNDISSHGGNEVPKAHGGGNPYSMAAESLIPRLNDLYQEVKSR